MERAFSKGNRPSWDDYFLELADAASKRATCNRGKSGCVIVRDKQVLATGYVGSPTGLPHCDDVGHLLKKVIQEDGAVTDHCVRTVHSEQNAICQAAKRYIYLGRNGVYQNDSLPNMRNAIDKLRHRASRL